MLNGMVYLYRSPLEMRKLVQLIQSAIILQLFKKSFKAKKCNKQ